MRTDARSAGNRARLAATCACLALGLTATETLPANAERVTAQQPTSQQARAQQSAAGHEARYLAGNCTTCHGTEGRPTDTQMPELAGLSPDYFVEQIRLFREGKREATIMNQIAKGYTEAEIVALAGYFSRQRPSNQQEAR